MMRDLYIKNLILFPKILLIKIKFNIYKIIIKLIYKYSYF